MSTFRRIRGNSLWINITCETYAEIDTTWANYSGTYKVVDSAGTELIASTSMTLSDTPGIMLLRITPAKMLTLPVGTHTLVSQILNASKLYEEERHDKLIITAAELLP